MDNYPKYISQEQQELFEKYLMDAMDDVEKKALESKLKADAKLNVKFSEFKTLFNTVEEAALREKMKYFHSAFDIENPEDKRRFPFKLNYRIAASIVILIAVGSIWYSGGQNKNEKLFQAYFVPDPGLPTVMGNNDNYAFYEAMVDYKRGKYEDAIKKWEVLLATRPENDTLNYFLGSAHLANENTEVALDYMSKTVSEEKSAFKNEALYYLGLGNLKLNRPDRAQTFFKLSTYEKAKEIEIKLSK